MTIYKFHPGEHMLQELVIENFTIIRNMHLETKQGMTVLTGETGAGKSILIDALSLALGGRADASQIYPGRDKTDISAVFLLDQQTRAAQYLATHGLNNVDADLTCILRCLINKKGRSQCYVNGKPVTKQILKGLGVLLVNIHGQHEHHGLLSPHEQLFHLDRYAGHNDLVQAVTLAAKSLKDIQLQLDLLQEAKNQEASQRDLLTYQLTELDGLHLTAGEVKSLEEKQRRYRHQESILEHCTSVSACLEADTGANVLESVTRIKKELQAITRYDDGLTNTLKLVDEAEINLQEAAAEVGAYINNIDHDHGELVQIEARLERLYDLSRKHRVDLGQLFEHYQTIKEALTDCSENDDKIHALTIEKEQALLKYQRAAHKLSLSRQRAANELSPEIVKLMNNLGMVQGKFAVKFTKLDIDQANTMGAEQLEFQVSTNPGQPLGALSKVISGGELSRISLSIQVLTAIKAPTPTLIFDEVDVGVGGSVAEIVGRLLKSLGQHCQVLCVTHLAQVASQAHQHVKVSKEIKATKTCYQVKNLSKNCRKQEIARMLGGVNITEQTLAHAGEMLGASMV